MALDDLRRARVELWREYRRGSLSRRQYRARSKAALRRVNRELLRKGGASEPQIETLLGSNEHRWPCPLCGKSPPEGKVWADFDAHVLRCKG